MPRPTSADLALVRSNLPTRRVAVPVTQPKTSFATMLQSASSTRTSTATAFGQGASAANAFGPGANLLSIASAGVGSAKPIVNPTSASGPAAMSRSEMLQNAQQLMNIPYVWGGNSSTGLDCSAFVSKAWGVARHTTDNLANVSRRITKEELQPGDALNLTTAQDDDGAGHIRLFDRWANPEKTKMWVYEETPPKSVHHVINWDPSYTPMRRLNVVEG